MTGKISCVLFLNLEGQCWTGQEFIACKMILHTPVLHSQIFLVVVVALVYGNLSWKSVTITPIRWLQQIQPSRLLRSKFSPIYCRLKLHSLIMLRAYRVWSVYPPIRLLGNNGRVHEIDILPVEYQVQIHKKEEIGAWLKMIEYLNLHWNMGRSFLSPRIRHPWPDLRSWSWYDSIVW